MNNSLTSIPPGGTPPQPPRKPPWPLHRHVFVWLGVLALIAAVVVGAGMLAWSSFMSDLDQHEKECCWSESATPSSVSKQLGIRPPVSATGRRAGYKDGTTYDTALLAFTLPSQEAAGYLSQVLPKNRPLGPNADPESKDYIPAAPFAHLGLPEPETLVEGMQKSSVCPDDDVPEENQVWQCVNVYAHEFTPGTTRLYFQATIG